MLDELFVNLKIRSKDFVGTQFFGSLAFGDLGQIPGKTF